jgi:hypothetical protein
LASLELLVLLLSPPNWGSVERSCALGVSTRETLKERLKPYLRTGAWKEK